MILLKSFVLPVLRFCASILSILVLVSFGCFADEYKVVPQEPVDGNVRVFQNAEGFGTLTAAGRNGAICFVENMNDEGEGSLRSCVEREGPRIVLFKVGGTIEVGSPIVIDHPHLSVYGQSAPGGGVLVRASHDTKGSPMKIRSHDILIQHLRLRAGTSLLQTCCRDAVRIGNAKVGEVYNIVLDHNSLSWGTDQIANTWYDTNNVTFSYNLIAESLHDNGSNDEGPAGRGLLIGSEGAHSISIHHNVIAHSYQRNPLLVTNGVVDVVNNLVYHWVSRGGEQRSTYPRQRVNWIKNHYIARETSIPLSEKSQESSVGWGDILLTEDKYPMRKSVYMEDNIGMNRKWSWQSNWMIANTGYAIAYDPKLNYLVRKRFIAPSVTEFPTAQLQSRLLPVVGATAPQRDSVDSRIVRQIKDRNGLMPNCVSADDRPGDEARCENNVGGWPEMSSGEMRIDTDQDGLPDSWELEMGLDPAKADSHLDSNSDGYTNLEDWLYALSMQSASKK